jgi:hypothetical protein
MGPGELLSKNRWAHVTTTCVYGTSPLPPTHTHVPLPPEARQTIFTLASWTVPVA